jgi:hypothetical protein
MFVLFAQFSLTRTNVPSQCQSPGVLRSLGPSPAISQGQLSPPSKLLFKLPLGLCKIATLRLAAHLDMAEPDDSRPLVWIDCEVWITAHPTSISACIRADTR